MFTQRVNSSRYIQALAFNPLSWRFAVRFVSVLAASISPIATASHSLPLVSPAASLLVCAPLSHYSETRVHIVANIDTYPVSPTVTRLAHHKNTVLLAPARSPRSLSFGRRSLHTALCCDVARAPVCPSFALCIFSVFSRTVVTPTRCAACLLPRHGSQHVHSAAVCVCGGVWRHTRRATARVCRLHWQHTLHPR